MSGIDVLSMMDDEIASLPVMAAACGPNIKGNADEAVRRMTEARAAVAELIEAANEMASPSMSATYPGKGEATIGWQRGEKSADERLKRLRAALSRVQP